VRAFCKPHLGREARFLHDQRVTDRQHDAEQRHACEGFAPAESRSEETTEGDAEHRPDHAAGEERATDRCAHPHREHAEHHRQADTPVGGFAHPDEKACNEHLFEAVRNPAPQCGQAPQRRHENQAAQPAPSVRQQGQWQCQGAYSQGDDAAERAELRVGEIPFCLEEREYGVQHLPRHIVREQQAEGQRKHQPRVVASPDTLGLAAFVCDSGVGELHGA
jgi:hypothetical protein